MLSLRRYTQSDAERWNDFVRRSKNGTFLLDRNFMEYHSDRFDDHSLMVCDGNRLVALLPANYDANARTLYSHQGLTYGGLIMSHKTSGAQVVEAMDMIVGYCRAELGAERLVYKPIPYIYNKYPSEEDTYALYRHDARLVSRGLSSCIDLSCRMPYTESRRSGLRRSGGVTVRKTDDTQGFWNILNEVLTTQHSVKPVHTPEEMTLLMQRFPSEVSLYCAYYEDGTMLAGTLLFDSGLTMHTQYMAASQRGKSCGALDKVIVHVIEKVCRTQRYLDFGISTENGGRLLNGGLLFQKEGFGGRGVCYDTYEISIK